MVEVECSKERTQMYLSEQVKCMIVLRKLSLYHKVLDLKLRTWPISHFSVIIFFPFHGIEIFIKGVS